MNDNKLINIIENSTEDELQLMLDQLKGLPNTRLQQSISTNDITLKNLLLENTDIIIKLFTNIKAISEDFQKSKKNLETMNSQMLM
jgi:hypothetical protein